MTIIAGPPGRNATLRRMCLLFNLASNTRATRLQATTNFPCITISFGPYYFYFHFLHFLLLFFSFSILLQSSAHLCPSSWRTLSLSSLPSPSSRPYTFLLSSPSFRFTSLASPPSSVQFILSYFILSIKHSLQCPFSFACSLYSLVTFSLLL